MNKIRVAQVISAEYGMINIDEAIASLNRLEDNLKLAFNNKEGNEYIDECSKMRLRLSEIKYRLDWGVRQKFAEQSPNIPDEVYDEASRTYEREHLGKW